MQKIIALWATPRTTSTAFEWMIRQRGDLTCFHEPFGEWWYKGDDARWPRITINSPRIPGLTFESVWNKLCGATQQHPVFVKDFPHYSKHVWSDNFLNHFHHSFLIRDPAKITTSMYKHWPEFLIEELGIVEQRELFDRVTDQIGTVPPLIDSDDLLQNPQGIVETWCNAIGIPFIPEALSWKPGDRTAVSWYDGGSWHENLRDSDGLKPQPRQYIDISQVPDRVKEIYEIVLPHYQHMYNFRLRP